MLLDAEDHGVGNDSYENCQAQQKFSIWNYFKRLNENDNALMTKYKGYRAQFTLSFIHINQQIQSKIEPKSGPASVLPRILPQSAPQ